MDIGLKAELVTTIQEWLDKEEVADKLGATSAIWQDDSAVMRNAHLMAGACEIVVDSMALQSELERELNSD